MYEETPNNEEGVEIEPESPEVQETPTEEVTPDYLFGDVTSDEATERFGYLRDLPNHLRGLESRVSDTVNPVLEQLNSLQEKIGSQPTFEPALEKVGAVLKDYDPKLAEALLPALIEDLKSSLSITPLGPETLAPHINPMLEQTQQDLLNQVVPTMLDSLPFDANDIVNRDPQNPDTVLAPKTELQKDFSKWWDQLDAPTRKALGTVGIPYVQALQRFGKWRAELLRNRGKAAGSASARLEGAVQKPRGGQKDASTRKLETEDDGFNYYFNKQRR